MLAGISASDLEIILDFIYQGEINVSSEKLPSLLQAAQFLDIRALSPSALVLNSSQMSVPPPVAADKVIRFFFCTNAVIFKKLFFNFPGLCISLLAIPI